MLIQLNNGSEIPIYVQLRNQIVTGIGRGDLKEGEGILYLPVYMAPLL